MFLYYAIAVFFFHGMWSLVTNHFIYVGYIFVLFFVPHKEFITSQPAKLTSLRAHCKI